MAVRLSALRAGRSPFTPRKNLVLISVRGWVDPRAIVRLEGLGQLKNPVVSSGIEFATFRLVAQCLNQLPYRLPFKQLLTSLLTNSMIEHGTLSGNTCDLYSRSAWFESGPGNRLSWLRHFVSFLQTNTRIIPRIGHDHFLTKWSSVILSFGAA
jgi:hypothetical protein